MTRNPHLARLRLLYPVRWRVAAGLLAMAIGVLAQLAVPQAIAHVVDHVGELRRGAVPAGPLLALLAASVLLALAYGLRFYLFHSSGHMILARVRRDLFDALINQPIAFFDRHHVGELVSRLSADVLALHESLTVGAANSLRALCTSVGGIAMLLHLSPLLCLPLAVFVPANLYLGKVSGASYRQRARQAQAALADSGKVAQEHFANARLVQAFNQQAGARARYAAAAARLLALSVGNARQLALFQGALSLLLYLALLATVAFGGHLIAQGRMSAGELAAFVIYASMVTESANSLSDFWNGWMRTLGATDRIFEILDAPRPAAAGAAHHLAGQVALEDLTFRYPQRPAVDALAGISLSVASGERVALVGASGAGKSTIASLILGHYQPNAGRLRFDGVDAAGLDLAVVRRQLAIVEQEPALLSGTIAENIGFAVAERTVPLAEVIAAARQANAHEFISAFPDGYETVVGERGVQLSGGQKQRIAIARALLRDPKILILDEATSALDAAAEAAVQAALTTLMRNRTVIIIAHRLSTIAHADRIVVLEQGAIVQQGSHHALMRQPDGPYVRLVRHQLAQHAGADAPGTPVMAT
jgi:ATP-binding cassette subfamily B protein